MKPDLTTLAHDIRTYFEDRNIPADGLTVILQVPTASAARLSRAVAYELTQMTSPSIRANTWSLEIEGVKFLIVGPHADNP